MTHSIQCVTWEIFHILTYDRNVRRILNKSVFRPLFYDRKSVLVLTVMYLIIYNVISKLKFTSAIIIRKMSYVEQVYTT